MFRGSRAESARLDRLDRWLGLAIFLAGAAYLVLLHQHELWGDGQGMYQRLERESDPWWSLHYHAAYFPVVRLLGWLAPTALPIDGYLLGSSLPIAAGMAFNLWSLRLLGVGRGAACAIAVVTGLTPSLVVFGTLLEVHALHFGGVSLAILVSILALRLASARAILVVHAIAFFAISATHSTAPVLVPGWAAWCTLLLWSRRAGGSDGDVPGEPSRPTRSQALRTWFASSVGATLSIAVTALLVEFGWRANRGEGGLSFIVEVVDTALESVAPRMILDEWVFAYGYALAPIVVSVLLMLHPPTRRAFLGRSKALPFVLGVWMIVPMIALNIWSVHNRGGYTAALAPMVAIGLGAASLAVEPRALRRLWIGIAGVAALVQPVASGTAVWERDRLFVDNRPEVYAEAVAALPEGGALITYSPLEYNVAVFEPGWRQVNVDLLMRLGADGAFVHDPRGWVVHEIVRPGGPAVLDLRFASAPMPPGTPLAAHKAAFDAAIAEFFEFEAVEPSVGLVTVLRPKPAAVELSRQGGS